MWRKWDNIAPYRDPAGEGGDGGGGNENPESGNPPSFDPAVFKAELKKELFDDLRGTITGSTGRIKRELELSLPEAVASKLDLKNQISALLAEHLPKQPKEEEKPTNQETETQDKRLSEILASFEQLKQKNESTEKRYEVLREQFKASEEARQEEQLARHRMEVEKKFYGEVADKVQDPEQFLLSIKHFGQAIEKDGTFGVSEKDKFGEDVFVPITDKIDDLLKMPRFAIHAKPRPGNGLGSSPNNGKPAGTPQSQFFGASPMSPEALGKVATTQGGFENLLADMLSSTQ